MEKEGRRRKKRKWYLSCQQERFPSDSTVPEFYILRQGTRHLPTSGFPVSPTTLTALTLLCRTLGFCFLHIQQLSSRCPRQWLVCHSQLPMPARLRGNNEKGLSYLLPSTCKVFIYLSIFGTAISGSGGDPFTVLIVQRVSSQALTRHDRQSVDTSHVPITFTLNPLPLLSTL